MNFLSAVINFLLIVVFIGLGGVLLLAGRHYLWILLGAGGFLITLALAAEIQGYMNSMALMEENDWISILIALGLGAGGVLIGRNYKSLSHDIIGFSVGLYIASWFDEILLVLNGQEQNDFTWWVLLVFIGFGILCVWITRQDPEQSMILISVIIGANTIIEALNLDQASSFTAVIALSLALTGVVVQYASYLRERPRLGRQLPPVPHPVSDELPYE
jgi:peptidoglycan/LPS O-acetylase OafA/YrhL